MVSEQVNLIYETHPYGQIKKKVLNHFTLLGSIGGATPQHLNKFKLAPNMWVISKMAASRSEAVLMEQLHNTWTSVN